MAGRSALDNLGCFGPPRRRIGTASGLAPQLPRHHGTDSAVVVSKESRCVRLARQRRVLPVCRLVGAGLGGHGRRQLHGRPQRRTMTLFIGARRHPPASGCLTQLSISAWKCSVVHKVWPCRNGDCWSNRQRCLNLSAASKTWVALGKCGLNRLMSSVAFALDAQLRARAIQGRPANRLHRCSLRSPFDTPSRDSLAAACPTSGAMPGGRCRRSR